MALEDGLFGSLFGGGLGGGMMGAGGIDPSSSALTAPQQPVLPQGFDIEELLRKLREKAQGGPATDAPKIMDAPGDPAMPDMGGQAPLNQVASLADGKRAMDALSNISGQSTDSPAGAAMIQKYLKDGGVGLNPEQLAWCAAAVNSSMAQAGVKGTGSNMAKSFLNWGTRSPDPQPGDVAVFSRGNANGPLGHVGFFNGFDPNGNVRVFGGNQGDSVKESVFPASRLLDVRRAPDATSAPSGSAMAYAGQSPASGPPMPPPRPLQAMDQATATPDVTPSRGDADIPALWAKYNETDSPADFVRASNFMQQPGGGPQAASATTQTQPQRRGMFGNLFGSLAGPDAGPSDPSAPATAAGGGGGPISGALGLSNDSRNLLRAMMLSMASATDKRTPFANAPALMMAFQQAADKKDDRLYNRTKDQRDFDLRKSEAERAADQWKQSYGLQREQFDLTKSDKDKPQIIKDSDGNVFAVTPQQLRQSASGLPAAAAPTPAPTLAAPPPAGAPVAPDTAPSAPAPSLTPAPTGVAPMSGLSPLIKGQKAAPTTKVIKQADGSEVAVQWDPSGERWVPMLAPEGGNAVKAPQKITEQQSKDLNYYTRGVEANKTLEPMESALTSPKDAVASGIPGVGNYLVSGQYQQAQQAGREFLASILRKDSGAAISKNEETVYGKIFLPQPGDAPEVIAQKRASRTRAMGAMKMGLGPAEALVAAGIPKDSAAKIVQSTGEAQADAPAPSQAAPPAAQPTREDILNELRRRSGAAQ